eukprot:gene1464-32842_t
MRMANGLALHCVAMFGSMRMTTRILRRMSALRSSSKAALQTLCMPSTRNEEYRYTDVSSLLKTSIKLADPAANIDDVAPYMTLGAKGSTVVVVNGVMNASLSNLEGMPEQVYVGGIEGAPAGSASKLGELSASKGGPFSVLNGAYSQEVLCIVVPAGVTVEQPIHILHLSTGADGTERQINAPRLLVDAGKKASISLVEEYVQGIAGSSDNYFTCSVAEVFVGEGAHVTHGYAQREGAAAAHFKGTLVSQAAGSLYDLSEACVGASLARHDLGITQEGAATETTLRHFLLCGSGQLHDLHSKLDLSHPNGTANQLHKCIVSHSTGKGVFDGNVQVNKYAQKTDAGQLSRNLLLVPKATVNVKPNLQEHKGRRGRLTEEMGSIEDGRHEISAASEQGSSWARGIDAATARAALVYSFGSAVVQSFKILPELRRRIEEDVSKTLKEVELTAAPAAAKAVTA